ncbi:MAG: hypothetical protein KatS3mg082_3365 [Nitrospiraceae bacterium]|nr:MAG: hypothetical protein KatS3mg082_3365 [Nitrospiraceae bacterium]
MNSSEYWRLAVQQAAEEMVEDIVDTVNDAIAKALRGQVARVYNPVAAALLGATGFHYLGPITNHPGGDTAQDGEVRWVQHIKFTDIKLEVRKDGNNVFVRLIDEPDAIDLAIRNAIDQAAAEIAPYLKNAIRQAAYHRRQSYIGHPFARMLLGAYGDQYLGPTQPSESDDYLVGADERWVQPIGETGVRVEVIMVDNELLIRPVD